MAGSEFGERYGEMAGRIHMVGMDIRIIDGQWLVLATAAATNTTSRHLPAPSLLAAIFSQSLSLMSLSRNNIAVRRLSYNNKSSFATNVNVRSAAASTTSRCGHNFSSVSNNNSNNSIISPVIRWGILSTGRIASDFVKAMSLVENAEVSVFHWFISMGGILPT